MSSYISRKIAGLALLAMFALAAAEAEADIDRQLDRSAAELTRELGQADRQFHESQRLGQSPTVTNQYGNATDIERQIDATVDEANAELARTVPIMDYDAKRRELETTRSLYYPNSDGYNQLTKQIEQLDRDYREGKFNNVTWP